jgi:hypothetical protein
LLPLNPITDPSLLDAMFTDPFYGLNDFENYAHWQTFGLSGTEAEIVNKKLAWAVEVQFYFGLTKSQVVELSTNWK